MGDQITERAALGNSAALGELYNARTDRFCLIRIFKKEISESCVLSIDKSMDKIDYFYSDKLSERFFKIGVKGELQVSVLAGLIQPKGSGGFLIHDQSEARNVSMSLIYNVTTKKETLQIEMEELKDNFSTDAISNDKATHFVTGISWGANCIMSAEYINTNDENKEEIRGKLGSHFNIIGNKIKGEGKGEFSKSEREFNEKMKVRVLADVLPPNKELPTTAEGALDLICQTPGLVKTFNDGKGKPMVYHLQPLSFLRKYLDNTQLSVEETSLFNRIINSTWDYLDFAAPADKILFFIEEAARFGIVEVFEDLAESVQTLNEVFNQVQNHSYCILESDVKEISQVKQDLMGYQATLRGKLATLLPRIRGGEVKSDKIEVLISKHHSSPYCFRQIQNKSKSWNHVMEKAKAKAMFAQALVNQGADYIGNGSSILFESKFERYIVFYFKQICMQNDNYDWNLNQQLFIEECRKDNEKTKLFLVDCDIHTDQWPKNGMTIQIMENGLVVNEDLLESYKEYLGIPLAKSIVQPTKYKIRPKKLTFLKIPCTGIRCNPAEVYIWKCENCKVQLEYDFQGNFFCLCGKAPAFSFEFKCSDSKHGFIFEKHSDQQHFEELLGSLRPFDERTYLIIGETGAGKSTWINMVFNMVRYDSLEEAKENKLFSVIPTRFAVPDENYQEVWVETGSNENEKFETGQSATQSSRVYSYVNDDEVLVRIIDTPGIGDVRGEHQDRANMRDILQTIANYEEIHCICVLLRPDDARLSVLFRYCITELLTYLHKDACDNIVFCFTKCRSTFYRPGNTLPNLEKHVNQYKSGITFAPSTLYCFDSEPYRFLAAIKNSTHPVSFSELEEHNFSESWNKFRAEFYRLFDHVRGLEPHAVNNTLSLNKSRELVEMVTEPMADICLTISIEQLSIENKSIEEPIKVCLNPKCSALTLSDLFFDL